MNFSFNALQIMVGFYLKCYTGLKWVKRQYSLPQVLDLGLSKCFYGSFVNRAETSSKNPKAFWRLRFGRRSVVRPLSNGERLRDNLTWNEHGNRREVLCLIHYDSLLQNATDIITKYDNYFITKCARFFNYKMRHFYYKIGQLLQTTTFVTTCDSITCFTFHCRKK